MKRSFPRLLAGLLLAAGAAFAATPQKILFIGNSYTHTNNLPGMVRAIANANGLTPAITIMAAGGRNFQDHWEGRNSTAVPLIQQGGWDVVVLQTQSYEPVGDPATMYHYGELLGDLIDQYNPGARKILYNTWAYETLAVIDGPGGQYPVETRPATLQEMQDRLNAAYKHLADLIGGTVAPCGQAWWSLRAESPAYDLFITDGSHPTRRGTYLNAVVMYDLIFGPFADLNPVIPSSLTGIPNTTGLTEDYTRLFNFSINAADKALTLKHAKLALDALAAPALLDQDFSTGAAVTDYVDAANPGTTKFNAITASNGGAFSIANAALNFAGSAGTGRGAVVRNGNFSGPPTKLVVSFDLAVTGNTVVKNAALQVNVGANFNTTTNSEPTANVHSAASFNVTATSGQFQVGTSLFTGRQTVMWVINNSGADYVYAAPGGASRTLANDRADLWVGGTLARSARLAITAALNLENLKFRYDLTGSAATVMIDDVLVYQPE